MQKLEKSKIQKLMDLLTETRGSIFFSKYICMLVIQ
jgi:hypothetical protein